jgi:hypothetical protein
MTSPRPTDLNFALPPGFVPAIRPVPAPAAAPAPVRRIGPAAPAPAIETTQPVARPKPVAQPTTVEPKPRAPRKPRATAPKAPATKAPTTKAAAPKPTTRRRTVTAVDGIVEHEAGRILEDAARTAADMLAAARRTAARLNAESAAEHDQRRRDMEDAVADLADYLDELAHRLRNGTALATR